MKIPFHIDILDDCSKHMIHSLNHNQCCHQNQTLYPLLFQGGILISETWKVTVAKKRKGMLTSEKLGYEMKTCWAICLKYFGLSTEFFKYSVAYRPGQANCKFQFSMPLVKNPQFWCNLAQTFSDCPHHGWVNSWKFEQNWTNIVDFSLIALKVEICN